MGMFEVSQAAAGRSLAGACARRQSCAAPEGASHCRVPAPLVQEFILRPLWRQAEKAPQGAAGGEGIAARLSSLLEEHRREALAAAAVVSAVAVGVLLWRRRSVQSTWTS